MSTGALAAAAAAVAAALAVPVSLAAGPAAFARLKPVAGSRVAGTATLAAAGGGTRVTLALKGLGPRSPARATFHAGTCANPSASLAIVLSAHAAADGSLRASGRILFRGRDDVPLATALNGPHVLVVRSGLGVVACGAVARR
jgi:hypothetical protein